MHDHFHVAVLQYIQLTQISKNLICMILTINHRIKSYGMPSYIYKTQKDRLHAHHSSHVLIKLRYINNSILLSENDVTKSNKCSRKCVQLFCLHQRRMEKSVQCYTMWQHRNNSWTVCSGCRRQDDRRHVRLQVHRGVGADQRQGGRPARRHHQSDPSPSTQLSPALESPVRRRRPSLAHQTHRTALWAPVVRVTLLRQPARALTNGM